MSPTLLSTLALLFVSFTQNANASWRMDSSNLLTARMDPLVSPNAVTAVRSISFVPFVTPPLTRFLLACSQRSGWQQICFYLQFRYAPPKHLLDCLSPGRQV
jgi:hypothetical protein